MGVACIDTSALVALLLDEPGAGAVSRVLARSDQVHASNLVEAELRSVMSREGVDPAGLDTVLAAIDWVFPVRSLRPEIDRILRVGHLRGADLWHVACALYLGESLAVSSFISTDERQRQVASALQLAVLP